MSDVSKMIDQAIEVLHKAYAPYSKFHVGACLRAANGELFVGCNVENAAYPLCACAETLAIGAMVAAGQREIKEIVVMGNNVLCPPCGGCRQRLSEFSSPETPVHICSTNGERKTTTMGALLPESFGAKHMGIL